MKPPAANFSRDARLAGWVGIFALVVAAGLGSLFPAAVAPAWRCAVFAWVGPALGSLLFVLVHQLTGGEWGRALRPYLLGGARLLPWTWLLLLLPLVFVATGESPSGDWWRYAGSTAVTLRAIGYGVVFWFFSSSAVRAWPQSGPVARLAWVGPAGLISLLFMTHLLATDWLAALDPRWISTAFPLVWLVGQSVAGLALAVVVASRAGAEPSRVIGPQRKLGIDWGTLLFAAAMLWCYVAFAQFLIVWSGNLPEEAAWFTRRLAGAWHYLPMVLVMLHFLAPLVVLLSRRAKQDRRALGLVAAALLAAQLLQTAWMVLPGYPDAPKAMPWLALVLVIGVGGLFANRYLVIAGREGVIV